MKMFLKILVRRAAQGLFFGVFYTLVTYFMGNDIRVLEIVYSSILYVIALCILGVAAPHLQKLFGFDKK